MCGEKQYVRCFCVFFVEDHPRVCGEKFSAFLAAMTTERITPAYAGKSGTYSSIWQFSRDHPRVCGEKEVMLNTQIYRLGSPPHVRGKATAGTVGNPAPGITPACAGKRPPAIAGNAPNQDHPRMCGEKCAWFWLSPLNWGSPPHVRGKAVTTNSMHLATGITPACAGKSLKRSRSTVSPVAIVPLFPSVCNKPVVSDGSPAGRDAPLFLPAENAVPVSPAYNLRSL